MTSFWDLATDIRRNIYVQAGKLAKREALQLCLRKRPLPEFCPNGTQQWQVTLIVTPSKVVQITMHPQEENRLTKVLDFSHIHIDLWVTPKRVRLSQFCNAEYIFLRGDRFERWENSWEQC